MFRSALFSTMPLLRYTRDMRIVNSIMLTCLAGCLGWGCSGYRPPLIEVVGSRWVDRSDEAVAFEIELLLMNPNSEPLELRMFEYTVDIAGERIYAGKRAAQATLSKGGEKVLKIPVVVRVDQDAREAVKLPPSSEMWTVHGSLLYITPGEIMQILLDTGFSRPTVRFAGRGEVSLTEG